MYIMFKLGKQLFYQNSLSFERLASNRLNQLGIGWTFRKYSSASYEGDGKTKVKVLNNDPEMGLMVNSFSQMGFTLNNKFNVIGPMVIFPRTVISWNVNTVDDINEHSLRLFLALEPKLELLIIGTGDTDVTPELSKRLLAIVKEHGIRVEILKTESACTTFNFMNAESRFVAAAMIPPKQIHFNDMGYLAEVKRQKQLYDTEHDEQIKIGS